MPAGPRVLLLGGLGMIGLSLLKYIVDYELASYVRVVDKRVPEMCFISQTYRELLTLKFVEFLQADLSTQGHVDRAFAGEPFSIIVNLASETQHGHMHVVYERSILQLRTLCAQTAAREGGCECYVEVSTAQVYASTNDSPSRETDTRLKPWTTMAKYHLEAERVVSSISQLPWMIVRLPIVYGPGDIRGLMPRIVCAAVYEKTGEHMEFLWGKDLRMHTAHVQDVVAAIWHIVCAGATHEVYNVVDDGDTTQGSLNVVLESMFKVKTGFFGAMICGMATLSLGAVAEEANEGLMEPWTAMLKENGISVTPLSPYLEKELLSADPLAIDGSKLRALGFRCSCPKVTKELLEDSLDYWVSLGLFPR
ncbi:NAD-dependent epimerase/dehydratase family protein [Trypanosoma rangeli]|uniref:NAD-dependent epimerase/dehydratase family protein n=1 Tax=Trypanosoma rangeli TaxID=5698 RepID=A0A422NRR3_TRYRA|nr:NAD-dependent epimerase/dehydratase family protein [Trypanosoma rangeli]RNF08141.1 NAD-dependent epimerase/dehydratase family protein [Trypanosoma rangeli]|eukprot:RNF08141.1 NAD-dependent epimerase/dehydratase family protein [Trypanosoma rangeli]